MDKLKTYLLIAGGISLLVIGVILRSLFDGRRGTGAIGQPDAVGDHIDTAGATAHAAGEAVDSSAALNNDIREGNTFAQSLVQRSREILAKAKDRSGSADR